jgi:hypothetical protein
MSVLILTLTEDHLKLLKNLRWGINAKNFISGTEDETEDPAPFRENTLYEGIDLILNGKGDQDPFTTDSFTQYTTEQKAEWDKLYAELPIALDIILYNGNFNLGTYKTRFHLRDWVKTN